MDFVKIVGDWEYVVISVHFILCMIGFYGIHLTTKMLLGIKIHDRDVVGGLDMEEGYLLLKVNHRPRQVAKLLKNEIYHISYKNETYNLIDVTYQGLTEEPGNTIIVLERR